MGLFRNNYKKLAVENNEELAGLSSRSRRTLMEMFDYLKTFNVSLFELEVIKKDLIGLAKEADMEDADLKDKIGMSKKSFCDSLVKDGMRPSYLERLLPVFRDLAIADFLLYALAWKIEGMPKLYGLSADFVLISLSYIAFMYFYTMVLQRKKAEHAMLGSKKKTLYGFLIFLAGFLYAMSGWPIGISNLPEFIIYGNGCVIFWGLLMFSAALFFGNNYYWDKCSEKYNWR